MTALVIAEHNNQQLRASTNAAVTAALQLSVDVTVLVAGFQCQTVVEMAERITGVARVLVVDDACYQTPLAESFEPLILHCCKDVKYLLAPATTFGKNLLPRVAAKLDVLQLSDVSAIIDANTYQRSIYAGNAIEIVECQEPVKVLTVRSTAFVPAAFGESKAIVEKIKFNINNKISRVIKQDSRISDRPELSSAKIVISGGRGLQSKDNFDRLVKIADRMGAAIGASRAAVDAGMAPNDLQVGQTGQVVAPTVYCAVGISGAIQHMAGMKDSKIIIAINKDPDAPIFQVADYGLVGDINEILQQWDQVLTEMNY